jgi:hypothetical protein
MVAIGCMMFTAVLAAQTPGGAVSPAGSSTGAVGRSPVAVVVSGIGASARAAARVSPAAAFGIEAAGGTVGSALGFAAVIALTGPGSCGDDLSCTLGIAATAVLLATAGSAALTYAVGRTFETEPSGWGAVAGAVAGAAAAIGVEHLLSEEADINMNDATRILVIAVTQGSLAALGSRIGAALR